MITLAQLCADHGMDARKARGVLRAKSIDKPYEWPAAEIDRILKLLAT